MRNLTLSNALHPLAWWVWAIGVATAASTTTSPLLLAILISAVTLVVVSCRARAIGTSGYSMYVLFGGIIIVFRIILHVIVGTKSGDTLLLRLPSIAMPSWAAGISLFGDVYLESIAAAATEGLRLATMVIAIGAANSLADPRRLLRSFPNALSEIGTAAVVAVTVAPQLVESFRRVNSARALRGDDAFRIRTLHRTIAPVLHDTLDRSLMLAGSMDARGYGRRSTVSNAARNTTTFLMLLGLCGMCVAQYLLLDASQNQNQGWSIPLLLVSALVGLLGVFIGAKRITRTQYRPSAWGRREWGVSVLGVLVGAMFIVLYNKQLISTTLDNNKDVLSLISVCIAASTALPSIIGGTEERHGNT